LFDTSLITDTKGSSIFQTVEEYIITKLKTLNKPEVNFTSKLRQNQLIYSISTSIKSFIMKEIKEAKFFSVSMDFTFDSSRKEQISFIIRYVAVDGNFVEIALKDFPSTTGSNTFNFLKLYVMIRS
jgi:hypothetical protein